MKRKTDPDVLLKRWNDEIEILYNQVVYLAHIDDVFWQVQAIAQANKQLHDKSDGIFLTWMINTYVATALVGVRRIGDGTRGNTVSLRRLIEDIESHGPSVLTRTRFVALYPEDLKLLGHRAFDSYAGAGNEFIRREVFRRDRKALNAALKDVADHASEHYAHIAKNPKAPSPTYGEMRGALKAVSDILERYYLLLTARSIASVVPSIPSPWLSVFRSPWLPKGVNVPSYVHLDEVRSPLQRAEKPQESVRLWASLH